MSGKRAKTAIIAGWILGLGTIAWSTALVSVGGWTLLLGWGLVPPLLLVAVRRQQEQSLSESIREALR
jgi:hypothetical protein